MAIYDIGILNKKGEVFSFNSTPQVITNNRFYLDYQIKNLPGFLFLLNKAQLYK